MNKVEKFLPAETLAELRLMRREQQADYGYDVGASALGEWDAGDDTELPRRVAGFSAISFAAAL
jgi:hypothetical protein